MEESGINQIIKQVYNFQLWHMPYRWQRKHISRTDLIWESRKEAQTGDLWVNEALINKGKVVGVGKEEPSG